MGYQDREYFRNQQNPYWTMLQATRACWGIVLAHVVVYLTVVLSQNPQYALEDYLRLDPQAMVHDWQWYRLLTASFIVDSPWHLAFALLLVWLMGQELEGIYGSLEFVAFYVIANVIGNLGQFLAYQFLLPPHLLIESFGPSGAALGILFLGVLHYPYRMVTYLLVPMQMWILGAIALTFDVFFFMQHVPGLVRLAVHAPTLLWAFSYHQFAWRIVGSWSWSPLRYRQPMKRQLAPIAQARPKNTKLHLEEDFVELPIQKAPRVVDEQLEAKMDAILEKVSKTGMDSLTTEEKNTLQHASEVLRRKKT